MRSSLFYTKHEYTVTPYVHSNIVHSVGNPISFIQRDNLLSYSYTNLYYIRTTRCRVSHGFILLGFVRVSLR